VHCTVVCGFAAVLFSSTAPGTKKNTSSGYDEVFFFGGALG
jgi:hypothetical protein